MKFIKVMDESIQVLDGETLSVPLSGICLVFGLEFEPLLRRAKRWQRTRPRAGITKTPNLGFTVPLSEVPGFLALARPASSDAKSRLSAIGGAFTQATDLLVRSGLSWTKQSRFSAMDIATMREMASRGASFTEIAIAFGTCKSAVSKCLSGKYSSAVH